MSEAQLKTMLSHGRCLNSMLRTTRPAAHYLNGTSPILACTITLNFSAVPAASPPGPNPTPNPYNPTPNPYNPTPNPYNPTPNPTSTPTPYNPTPVPTKKPHPPKPTPTPTPTQTPTPASPPNIGTCVGPTTCKCKVSSWTRICQSS